MTLIDTHVHIDFFPNPQQVAEEYEQHKIYTLFMTNLPEVFQKHQKNFNQFNYVRLCLGYHPQVVDEFRLKRSLFKDLIKNTRYIGEVGLDFNIEHKDVINQQIENFNFITSPEFNKGRIYSVHSRKAEDQVLKILKDNSVKHCIFHWYTGKLTTLDKIIDSGYYLSINPKMLYTKNGKKIIERVPLNRILFETDAPLAKINRKVIYPNQIQSIYNEYNKLIPNFEDIVFKNFKRLLIEKDLSKI